MINNRGKNFYFLKQDELNLNLYSDYLQLIDGGYYDYINNAVFLKISYNNKIIGVLPIHSAYEQIKNLEEEFSKYDFLEIIEQCIDIRLIKLLYQNNIDFTRYSALIKDDVAVPIRKIYNEYKIENKKILDTIEQDIKSNFGQKKLEKLEKNNWVKKKVNNQLKNEGHLTDSKKLSLDDKKKKIISQYASEKITPFLLNYFFKNNNVFEFYHTRNFNANFMVKQYKKGNLDKLREDFNIIISDNFEIDVFNDEFVSDNYLKCVLSSNLSNNYLYLGAITKEDYAKIRYISEKDRAELNNIITKIYEKYYSIFINNIIIVFNSHKVSNVQLESSKELLKELNVNIVNGLVELINNSFNNIVKKNINNFLLFSIFIV